MANYPYYAQKFWLPDTIERFSSLARYMECPGKTTLFWEGDESDFVYFVEEGYVTIFHYTPEGDTITLLLHHRGDLVGLGGVMDTHPREVCCETVGRCRLWAIPRNTFFDLMYQYPGLAVWVAADLAQRMKKIDKTVLRLVSMPANRRIAATLLELTDRTLASRETPAVVRVTHQELSNMVGICRQTTTAILGKFKEDGLLRTKKGSMELYDLEALRRIADTEE